MAREYLRGIAHCFFVFLSGRGRGLLFFSFSLGRERMKNVAFQTRVGPTSTCKSLKEFCF